MLHCLRLTRSHDGSEFVIQAIHVESFWADEATGGSFVRGASGEVTRVKESPAKIRGDIKHANAWG